MTGKGVVKEGYEAIAHAYTAERSVDSEDVRLLDDFRPRVRRGGRVLDAGCGGGKPVAETLARTFRVAGLDLAKAQLRLLANRVPPADPILGDMTRLPFRDGCFDGITSLYAIIHVPREEHGRLIREFRRVLRPSGIALLCMGELDLPADTADYMGTRMFWSHFDGATNRRMLTENGFEVLWERSVVDFSDPKARHRFFLVERR